MKRLCRQCGLVIPNRVVIDGKEHVLNNRKFCLTCSPFGKNNRNSITPFLRVKGRFYKEYSQEQKDRNKSSLYKRALERKEKLIAMSGGKCNSCGYNKCRRALTFHHKNRDSKLFGLTLNSLWSKSWEVIVKEWEKCTLLCCNCHMELENDNSDSVAKVNARYGTNF